MTISEATRREMHSRLVEVLGMEAADTLMEYLPPVGWADVATKHDIDALRTATKHDIDTFRTATKHDIDALGTRIDALTAATERNFDDVRSEFRHEIRSTFDQFEIRFTDKLTQQTRTLLLGASAMMAATISAVSALISVGH
ncbi:MAG TPA: hypothetical protein VHE57_11855 [Mycobacteriales bacterium]|nr:hypothetical protein [Mycobacteriales bacterium]